MHIPSSLLARTACVLGAAAWCAAPLRAQAHEHWITAGSFYPPVGATVTVAVCSGHYFPASSFALGDAVLAEVALVQPDGTRKPLSTTPSDKERTGAATLSAPGPHLAVMVLTRPRLASPIYEARAILIANGHPDDPAAYALGQGLELVPLEPVSVMNPGAALPLSLRLDGKPIAGSLSVTAADGRTDVLNIRPDSPARLRIRKVGIHLVTASVGGRGCSLVFEVRPQPKEQP